jgi:hypothetical protein
MWLNAPVTDDLVDSVMTDNPTACTVYKKIHDLFGELHSLQQGNMCAFAYW